MGERRILLITTGGTIDSEGGEAGLAPGSGASGSGQEVIALAAKGAGAWNVQVKELFRLDSSNIQPEEWQALAAEVDRARKEFCGVVITHGTDTMAYTAAMLSYMLAGIDLPVVLTGSQLPIGHPLTDASQNLHTAFQMAQSSVPGVFVAFDRKVILGTRAVKARTRSFDAFESINMPPVATVDTRGLVLDMEHLPRGKRAYRFLPGLCQDVFLLKLVPGTRPEVFATLADMGYRGIVVETFGAGGLHTLRRNLVEALRAATARGVIVVVVSQCLYEPSDFTLYEVGRQTLTAGVIEGRDMTTEAAVAKLMWALGNLNDGEEVRAFFAAAVAGEVGPV